MTFHGTCLSEKRLWGKIQFGQRRPFLRGLWLGRARCIRRVWNSLASRQTHRSRNFLSVTNLPLCLFGRGCRPLFNDPTCVALELHMRPAGASGCFPLPPLEYSLNTQDIIQAFTAAIFRYTRNFFPGPLHPNGGANADGRIDPNACSGTGRVLHLRANRAVSGSVRLFPRHFDHCHHGRSRFGPGAAHAL